MSRLLLVNGTDFLNLTDNASHLLLAIMDVGQPALTSMGMACSG
jgi:hypothetical protein